MRVGFIGAGFIGRALARLAVGNGYEVMLSNSRGPQTLLSTAVSIGAQVGTVEQAVGFAEMIVLAITFGQYASLPPTLLNGKIVLDANNYYPPRDGSIPVLDNRQATTSGLIAGHFAGARVVKAFNAIVERDIERDARPAGAADRRALPIAGDDAAAKAAVAALQDRIGFDVVDAGPLAEGWRFERARPAYCVRLDKAGLIRALADTGPNVTEGSWHA